ncbi:MULTISPECIES: DUF4123 domain-containing protein [unclassified Pseudomonas]|uniref:DUF4123 domain-containing protein n=1 Tax=unclassified Pseudomonas TaxID=196821 RepID=UPI0011F05FA7|nr:MULTISPECIES: DUF4123 domain-containing protein [unclassified Pseudomonas]KAA0943834.1 DUF4123 domain-containing protein [Pseudomonas sp. ANT_H4]KAA0950924.1 DUF4123 domain-containing protein [Pseudomonas sp. ANT_H14]
MMAACPRQWMIDQLKLDHALCLILDSEGEFDARQALLNTCQPDQHRSVYSETQVSALADAGPFIFLIDNPDDGRIKELLKVPERNWGWLASIRKDDLPALTQHWRERIIIGTRPNQALYRFHDNRVLTRALGHIPEEARPEYLGPAISVCYWEGARWEVTHNPVPGEHPLPADPMWLNIPLPASQSMEILQSNIYRYLWAEHSDDLVRLSQRQDPSTWLAEQLSQAQQWGWSAPEQVHFLIINKLNETELPIMKNWLPHAGEAPQVHFERLFDEAKFWSGEQSA